MSGINIYLVGNSESPVHHQRTHISTHAFDVSLAGMKQHNSNVLLPSEITIYGTYLFYTETVWNISGIFPSTIGKQSVDCVPFESGIP